MTHNCPHITSFVPVYYWRGARPTLIDLDAHQTGWLVCLTLQREGDACLLPLAWQENNMPQPYAPMPRPTIHTKALDSTAVSLTLNQLQQDGWHINGRLHLTFTGHDTIPNFQQHIQQYLWQTPES